MKQPITLEALQVLDAIDRRGSFAAAADYMNRVPSAVTYAMQKLEQDLDVTLFRKQGRRSVLTPAGEVLLQQGRDILEATRRLAETTRQVERGWESRLNIAIDALLPFASIADGLQQFLQLHTGTEIRLREEILSGSWEALAEGRADLVVGAPVLASVPADIEVRALPTVDFVFAVAPDHPLAKPPRPLQAEDLQSHRAVVIQDTARHRSALTSRVFDAQPLLGVASLQQKIETQARGLGVGYLPRCMIETELEQGRLVLPPIAEQPPPAERLMIWRKGLDGRALHWFVDWFSRV